MKTLILHFFFLNNQDFLYQYGWVKVFEFNKNFNLKKKNFKNLILNIKNHLTKKWHVFFCQSVVNKIFVAYSKL